MSDDQQRRKRIARFAAVTAVIGGASVALGWFGGSGDDVEPRVRSNYDMTRPGSTVVLKVLAPILY